ncbi:MAG: hypothetical protein U9O82_11780 [Thermodesulfobacteriota bacterium]|nr:hypothetical protein [Thermodesulfobacteriota bacterium]
MKKKIEIEIEFDGTGKLVKKPRGWIEKKGSEKGVKSHFDLTLIL